ncbi:chalcone isomerase family protein [Aquimarina agarilytica]|uniref:chalcone isomerase family protein n=1 Tax=Aquimarina agarilytica TaxID=1087449 RepID=UPI000288F623|nr:chalcone isomerase family protein [Aquimarina agarilytica]
MKHFFLLLILTSYCSLAQTRVKRIISKTAPSTQHQELNNKDINRLNLESKIVGKAALPILYRFKNKQLILNGAGLRELLWVDIYACGLYMNKPNSNAKDIIEKDEAMIVRMDIISKAVSHDKMVKAFRKGFIDGNDKNIITKYGSEIDEFLKHIEGLVLKIGDKIDVVYEPNLGVSLYINYEKLGTVGDLGFKRAIFNIWLSKNPVDKSLRGELLEGATVYLAADNR